MATKEKPSFATETTKSLSKIPFNIKQLHYQSRAKLEMVSVFFSKSVIGRKVK
jgi:hypothetical protein